jgi:hypothetical protein
MPGRETSAFILLLIQWHIECVPWAVHLPAPVKLCLRMAMLTAVPMLPSQFQGVDTDSFTFCCTEIPMTLDIQMTFCNEEKYEGDSIGGCVY